MITALSRAETESLRFADHQPRPLVVQPRQQHFLRRIYHNLCVDRDTAVYQTGSKGKQSQQDRQNISDPKAGECRTLFHLNLQYAALYAGGAGSFFMQKYFVSVYHR